MGFLIFYSLSLFLISTYTPLGVILGHLFLGFSSWQKVLFISGEDLEQQHAETRIYSQ